MKEPRACFGGYDTCSKCTACSIASPCQRHTQYSNVASQPCLLPKAAVFSTAAFHTGDRLGDSRPVPSSRATANALRSPCTKPEQPLMQATYWTLYLKYMYCHCGGAIHSSWLSAASQPLQRPRTVTVKERPHCPTVGNK